MLGGIAFSVYEWLKCALVRHSFLIVEGSIDKMKNIYPLNSRFTLPFAFVLAVSLLAVSLMFMLPSGLLHAQTGPIEYPENGTGPVATFTAVDPEGESIVWSLAAGNDMEDFAIENGVLRFVSSPDFEMPSDGGADNIYVVTITASDGGANTTATETVTINVTNVEEPGMITLSTLQPQVDEDIIATLSDPDTIDATDQAAVTWQWYRGNNPIAGATDATVNNTVPTSTYIPAAGDIGSVVSAKAMYDDDEGDDKTAEQDSAHAAREAPTSNVPPTFPTLAGETDTNQTREISENTLAGTNIGDPVTASDTDVLTYSLEDDADASSFDINRATGHLITKAPLDYEDSGNSDHLFIVNVTATDPFGALTMAQVTITVTDVNEAPELAGVVSIDLAENITGLNDSDTSVTEGQFTVTDEDEDDNVSDDADIKWLLSGADSSKFQLTTTGATRTLSFEAMPNFESPGDSDGNNVYEVTVMVTDTDSNTDSQAVMVKVTNVEEPGSIEFSTLQPRVGFPVTATLTDQDNVNEDDLEWQWYRGDTFTAVTASEEDECDGATDDDCLIKGATSASYRPAVGDVNHRLTAVASYTDGNANDGDAKDVVVARGETDVLAATANQAPEFPDQDADTEGLQTAQERSIAENTAAAQNIGNVVAAVDEDTFLTYALGGPDASSFDIDRGGVMQTAGQLKTKAALDKEDKDTYTVTVTATDSLGRSSTITVTINVTDVDEMPELTGEAPDEYAENGTAAVATFRATDPEGKSIIWDLTGDDAEDFSIEGGVLRFEESPDYEDTDDEGSNNTYEFTIQASDGGQNTTATMDVSIDVTNVDEDGTIILDTLQPQVGVTMMATLTDPDGATESTVTWQWERGNSPITNANEGGGSNESVYTPAAGDIGSTLRAVATYRDGEDEDEDKSARGVSFRSVRSAPGSNTPPVFPDQDLNADGVQKNQTREVAENTAAGRNIGPPVVANDSGDLLTYSLSGGGAVSFDIVRNSGQIKTKAALDFETTRSYSVTVTATDPFDASDESIVTITVTDVNEDPAFTAGVMSIDHEEGTTVLDADGSTDTVDPAEYTISDQDDDGNTADLDWELTGADGDKFELTDNGAMRTLSFKDEPDFESPTDSGSDNVYNVTVDVTDSDGNTAERAVTVKVTNMEEDGTVTLSTLQPRIGFPLTATLTDADNITAGSVSWQWYKGNVQDQVALMTLDEAECDDGTNTSNCFIKGATSATYRPGMNDGQDKLVAVALYTDGSQNDPADAKDFAMAPTAQNVLADTRNKAPVFPDQDDEMEGDQTDQERSVMENAPKIGNNMAIEGVRPLIGNAVTAMDFITANDGSQTDEILTYSLGGPDAESFTINRSTAVISTTAVPLDTETKDTYVVTVTATDPSGLSVTITVTITVTGVDEAPIIMIGGLAISGMRSVPYVENDTDAVATYTAVGPESTSTTWSLSGDDAGDFNITAAGGELRFNASPDYETPRDADTNNVYMITVKADDGTYTDTRDVTIRVTDVDEEPRTILGPSDVDYAENDTGPVETYTLSGVNAATATWTLDGPDADAFTIRGGVLLFKIPPDFETKTTYMVTIEADDGTEMDSLDVTVTVTDVDEALTTISGPSNTDYAENDTDDVATFTAMDPEGTAISWTLEGTDAGVFDISNGGVLTFKSPPDYEMPADADNNNTYMVTVKADGVTYDVTIMVTNVDEALTTISGPSNTDYAENGTNNVATFIAMDPEEATITWSLSGTDADVFDISSGGVLTFGSSPDYEMSADADNNNIYMITVEASAGTDMDSLDVTVTVTDEDEVPTIAGDATIDYAENGTGDVATYTAMDPEEATITWSLSGTDAGVFGISGAGVLTFNESPDYEMPADADNIYMVTVEASAGTNMASHEVTVTVTDVDEALTSISGPSNTDYAENRTDDVATFISMDPDGTAISWSLAGDDADVFDISSGGVLTFGSSPDYEMSADADNNNIYMITVEASAGTNMASHEVTVTVTDVDEALTSISGPSNTDYAENGTNNVATFIAMDPEEATITWSLSGTDADVFDISSGGVLTFGSSPDYEMSADADNNNIYMITVNASAGTDMDSLDVTVTVTDEDEVPTIAGDATIDYAENGTGDVATYTAMDPEETAISWSLAGDDAGVFDIVGGVLTFKESPDFEMPADADTDNTYMVTVEASAGTNMASHEVTVTVTNVDDTIVEQTLLERYDANDNDQIDPLELREAIIHYVGGDIDSAQLRTLIILYITG